MKGTFKDDKFTIIENDLEKIMARPTMYISSIGSIGILHLCKEIINNNTDECYKKESPGNSIYIEITDKYIMSKDNGRGIPTNLIRKIHETLQAGSNMTRSSGFTAGENGAGTSTYTALARRLELESLRPQEKKKITLVYENGKLKSEKVEPYTGKEHGMKTKFWPSKKILGEDQIPIDLIVEWLNMNFRFTLPSDINIVYKINNGKDIKLPHLPVKAFFDEFIKGDQRMSSILSLKCSGGLKEVAWNSDEDREVTYDRHFEVEAAIVYSDPHYKGEQIKNSWMNMIFNKDNGDHINAVERAFVNFIAEAAIKKNKRLADEDLKGRHIILELKVNSVAKNALGFPYIVSDLGRNSFKSIHLFLDKKDPFLRKIKKGSKIWVYAASEGFVFNTVKLKGEIVDILTENFLKKK